MFAAERDHHAGETGSELGDRCRHQQLSTMWTLQQWRLSSVPKQASLRRVVSVLVSVHARLPEFVGIRATL
jgi:hypothetical protein